MNRLCFIRCCLLALLGVVAALLWRRTCAGHGSCSGCSEFARCALSWKESAR
ncbi:MAG: hypothetical protein N3B01_10865 [Verrucomicrobiae bacterium]|nr:hypothetical protein [Verrucomicrobiae bacterium]